MGHILKFKTKYWEHDKFKECLLTHPKHVALVAMGPTRQHFTQFTNRIDRQQSFPDEIWGINFVADWLKADKIFLMDGVHYHEMKRGENQYVMGSWSIGDNAPVNEPYEGWHERIKSYDMPFIVPYERLGWSTCFGQPFVYRGVRNLGWQNAVAYPLERVIRKVGHAFIEMRTTRRRTRFNNSVAYALAYAASLDSVRRIDCFGLDYDYRDDFGNAIPLEMGRAGTEYWLGYLRGRGVEVVLPTDSTLMDADQPKFYGYTWPPKIRVSA